MRQQSFVGRVWLDITEREKSHPIIYMTEVGKVSDVNAMRLTSALPLLIQCSQLHWQNTSSTASPLGIRPTSLVGRDLVAQISLNSLGKEGTCQGTWVLVLQQGTSSHKKSPSWMQEQSRHSRCQVNKSWLLKEKKTRTESKETHTNPNL